MATIKAGTYVFKETPVAASPAVGTAIEYKTYVLTANNTYSNTLQPWHYINSGYTFYGSSQVFCVQMSNSTGGTDFDNKFYAEDVGWVQWYFADGEYTPKYTATDTTKLRTIIVETDQTVPDDFYTWFNANIEKTLKQSVEQHITDAYTAIGNKSGTIPTQKNLQNLAGAINTISTGVDTSDGNIEPTTVLKGYKGYAKGVAVDGAIETYEGMVEDVGEIWRINSRGTTNPTNFNIIGKVFITNTDIKIEGNYIRFYYNGLRMFSDSSGNALYPGVFINSETEFSYSADGSAFTKISFDNTSGKFLMLEIKGGADSNNTQFRSWLQANATKQ